MSSVSLNAISYNIYVYIAKVLQPDTASHLQLVTQEFYIQKHGTIKLIFIPFQSDDEKLVFFNMCW